MYCSFLAGSIVALSVCRTVAAGYAWSGVNIAGFDFGCIITGECDLSKVVPPLHQYKGQDGAGQMKHFVDNDGLNAFRLPVGWQYLVNNQLGGTLDATNFKKYDDLVQACLVTGAWCIIDIHNYARWDGKIIGQSGPDGPTDEDFACLWRELATKYASEDKVVMGLMNEPHDVPDMTAWAASCQAAVTAIRKAGAINHHILLPGTGYTSAESFVSSGSAAALGKVKNLDGSVDNLIFDVHKYLDEDNSGTHSGCVSNAISTAFQPLAKYLTENKRVALLAEIGGGSSNSSCMTALCQVADFLNENSGAYLGMLGWGAGSFDDTYVLSLSPKQNGATWTDKPLLTKCIAGKFSGGSGYNTTTQSPPSSGGSSAGSSAGSYPSASSNPISSAPQPTSTYTPPTGPAPTAGGSGGNVPISYGAPMSWGTGNSTGSLTATGGNTATGTTSYQPTTFATSIVSTSAHGYGGYSSSTDTAAPASSSPALMRPGNNDGASVWGTKSHRPQHGSQDGKKMQGQQTSASGGHGGEDGDDCTSEYV